MAIGINWEDIWEDVWGDVWQQTADTQAENRYGTWQPIPVRRGPSLPPRKRKKKKPLTPELAVALMMLLED